MRSAATIRLQIEAALAHRISSALTPAARSIRPVAPTGLAEVDVLTVFGELLMGQREVVDVLTGDRRMRIESNLREIAFKRVALCKGCERCEE